MDRPGNDEGAEEQAEGDELAEDQHPDHGIAGEIFQDSPARSLLFAIGRRHRLSGSGHRPDLAQPSSSEFVAGQTGGPPAEMFAPTQRPARRSAVRTDSGFAKSGEQ